MFTNDQITEWYPIKYLQEESQKFKDENYAIVVLNRPINVAKFPELWNKGEIYSIHFILFKTLSSAATIRQCVDGGLNRFIEYKEKCTELLKPPYLISGDFDSCSLKSMEYAKSEKCKIVETPDQNETDFTKALHALAPELEQMEINSVLVVCDSSGRLDQIMANINTLFKSRSFFKGSCEVMLLSSNSLSFLLLPGSHAIHIPRKIVSSKNWCGLIPFTKSIVSTKGLKWNLNNTCMEFGGMVSTSNTYRNDAEYVQVTTNNSLIWSMGIFPKDE